MKTYHQHNTAFDSLPKHLKDFFKDKLDIFYKEHSTFYANKVSDPYIKTTIFDISCLERTWEKNGKRFFNLSNCMIEDFTNINLNIKWENFHNTHNPCVINLPINNPLRTIWEHQEYEVKSILFGFMYDANKLPFIAITVFLGNESYTCKRPLYTRFYPVKSTIEKSIECHLDNAITDMLSKGDIAPIELSEKLIKIIFATVLFATNFHIVPNSINLQPIFDKYSHSNNKRRKNFVKKFQDNIDTSINSNSYSLDLFNEYIKNISIDNKSHSELKYQHIRTGHFRNVHYGKERKQTKQVWINQTTVRKDLPMKPIC